MQKRNTKRRDFNAKMDTYLNTHTHVYKKGKGMPLFNNIHIKLEQVKYTCIVRSGITIMYTRSLISRRYTHVSYLSIIQ